MLIINNCVCIKKGYTRAEFIRSPLYDNQDMSMFFWLDQVVDIAGLDGKFGIGFYFGRKVLKSVYLSYRGEDCRITIHVLQLNKEKAETSILC